MATTGGYFNSWLLYWHRLQYGLVTAPDSTKFRLIRHNSTLIGADATKAEIIAAELAEENGYSRYNYAIALNDITFEAGSYRAIAPTRQWTTTASGATLQWSGAAMLANASDSANATCTATTGTDRINLSAHGLTDGDEVLFTSAGAVFGGLTAATIYYVVNPTTDDFQVEASVGGGAIDITDTGSGTVTLHYANGDIVSGFTHDTPQDIFDGGNDRVDWELPALLNTTASTGDSWG